MNDVGSSPCRCFHKANKVTCPATTCEPSQCPVAGKPQENTQDTHTHTMSTSFMVLIVPKGRPMSCVPCPVARVLLMSVPYAN